MYSAKIKSLYEEYGELIEFCRSNGQVSFELYINDTYKKALLLSAASYFETVITKQNVMWKSFRLLTTKQ